jgi:hypothetical protein
MDDVESPQVALPGEREGELHFGSAAGAGHDVGLGDLLHQGDAKSSACFLRLRIKQASVVADLDDTAELPPGLGRTFA